ncbi:hypothetical protein EXIGLDRAFT_780329 [Exidia glandulosa HHB12029]|uniref:Uncharacterized protein n=1 Tax=Exidia glandulosa HHB12029 TaxID=1314781 RepID=A0A165BNC1_EXIGL|nr:hypothetical protein EXIGLDRAFT_780329 [Exidia glandulosa HHB12029]
MLNAPLTAAIAAAVLLLLVAIAMFIQPTRWGRRRRDNRVHNPQTRDPEAHALPMQPLEEIRRNAVTPRNSIDVRLILEPAAARIRADHVASKMALNTPVERDLTTTESASPPT